MKTWFDQKMEEGFFLPTGYWLFFLTVRFFYLKGLIKFKYFYHQYFQFSIEYLDHIYFLLTVLI